MPVTRELFRSIAGSFPTGVLVVTTLDERGQPKGLTTQAFMALSTEPPLMAVAIDRTARTLAALRRHRAFVVNFLRAGSEDLARVFASKSDVKFQRIRTAPSPEAGGAPILREAAVAYAACVVTREIESGDHWMFVGRVEAGERFEGVPLMYYRRTYAAWPEETPGPPLE